MANVFSTMTDHEFQMLCELMEPRLYGFAFNRMKNRQDAEDTVQETFVIAVHKRDLIDPNRNPAAWLFEVCRRVCSDKRRTRARQHAKLTKAHEPAFSRDFVARSEIRDSLRHCWSTLNPKLQEIVESRLIEERGFQEMAERFCKSVGWIHILFMRGLESLKLCLHAQGIEGDTVWEAFTC